MGWLDWIRSIIGKIWQSPEPDVDAMHEEEMLDEDDEDDEDDQDEFVF